MVRPSTQGPVVVQHFTSLSAGGAEVRTLELLSAVPFDSVQTVIFQTAPSEGPLTERFRAAGCVVNTERFRSPRMWLLMVRTLLRKEVNAIHLHVKRGNSMPALFLPLAWCCNVPVRIAHFRSDGDQGRLTAREWCLRRLIALFATHIIGVSPGALDFGWRADWRDDPRCKVMLSGLDLGKFGALESGLLRKETGAMGPIVVHVGRDAPVKNRCRAIEIVAAFPPSDLSLVFIGRDSPDSRAACDQTIIDQGLVGRVFFLGERSDLVDLLSGADALLLTSLHEGLPGVVLEAHAAGLPVLATDLPGTRFIQERISNVELCSLDSPNSIWVKGLVKCLENSSQIVPGGSQFLSSEFSMDRAVAGFVSLWTCGQYLSDDASIARQEDTGDYV